MSHNQYVFCAVSCCTTSPRQIFRIGTLKRIFSSLRFNTLISSPSPPINSKPMWLNDGKPTGGGGRKKNPPPETVGVSYCSSSSNFSSCFFAVSQPNFGPPPVLLLCLSLSRLQSSAARGSACITRPELVKHEEQSPHSFFFLSPFPFFPPSRSLLKGKGKEKGEEVGGWWWGGGRED